MSYVFPTRGRVTAGTGEDELIFGWEAKASTLITFVLDTPKERLGVIGQGKLTHVTADVAKNALTACLSTAPSVSSTVVDELRVKLDQLFANLVRPPKAV